MHTLGCNRSPDGIKSHLPCVTWESSCRNVWQMFAPRPNVKILKDNITKRKLVTGAEQTPYLINILLIFSNILKFGEIDKVHTIAPEQTPKELTPKIN